MEDNGTLNIAVVNLGRWLGYLNHLLSAVRLFNDARSRVDLICLVGGNKRIEDDAIGICDMHNIPLGRVKVSQPDHNQFFDGYLEGVNQIIIMTSRCSFLRDWYTFQKLLAPGYWNIATLCLGDGK